MDTIVSLIDNSCRTFGPRTALQEKEKGGWRGTSYAELYRCIDRVAAGLAHAGFQPGNHAAILAASSTAWIACYLGVLKRGGVIVPVDKELKATEAGHILGHSEARVLFVGRALLDFALGLAERLPQLRLLVVIGSAPGERFEPPLGARCAVLPLEEFWKEGVDAHSPRLPHDVALILYTSGTTGRSKGAMLSHGNVVSNIRGTALHMGVDETIHTLSFLPINHVFEQVCGVLLPLSLGGKVSFCESLKKLGENLAEVRPTFVVGVPAVYRMMLERIRRKIKERSLSRLIDAIPLTRPLVTYGVRKTLGRGTIFVSGGAALDPAIIEGFDRFGVPLLQGYGITETSPVIAVESLERRRIGTVGQILNGVEVRIEAPGADLVGEIWVRGTNVMKGYFKETGATAEALVEGWYRTGDLGRLDGDGYLIVCGRMKSLIVTPNGRNVYPEEVENEIQKSPFVAEVVVYAHGSGCGDEEIRAAVFPDRDALAEHAAGQWKATLSVSEVEALLRGEVARACESLAAYKKVKKVMVMDEEFPKTTTRKIKRQEVLALLADMVSSS